MGTRARSRGLVLVAALCLSSAASPRNGTPADPPPTTAPRDWWVGAKGYNALLADGPRTLAVCSAGILRTGRGRRQQMNWWSSLMQPTRADLFLDADDSAGDICSETDSYEPCDEDTGPASLRSISFWQTRGLVHARLRTSSEVLRTERWPDNIPGDAGLAARVQAVRAAWEPRKTALCSNGGGANAFVVSIGLRWISCLDSIKRAELELRGNQQYTWFARTRPDFAFSCIWQLPPGPPPIPRLLLGKEDMLLIGPRTFAEAILRGPVAYSKAGRPTKLPDFANKRIRVRRGSMFAETCDERTSGVDHSLFSAGGIVVDLRARPNGVLSSTSRRGPIIGAGSVARARGAESCSQWNRPLTACNDPLQQDGMKRPLPACIIAMPAAAAMAGVPREAKLAGAVLDEYASALGLRPAASPPGRPPPTNTTL
ncbi:hypothetical protein T492DRAFT_1104608 [Pavlovales sp. CCMP2436]|nr:hypothetical protein T492DRAFT_1104608 [Pavlovales sp. CCMP2436]